MGNFSKNPDSVLQDALGKGYSKVLFQQGKPVLDRELNLLADLASPQRLIRYHIGNGVPDGSDGFRIVTLNVAQNNFTIKAGRCLVVGREVVLASDTTYKTQPRPEHVLQVLPNGTSYVYLHVWTEEVNGTQDADLKNPGALDVGLETAVREKVLWEALVAPGVLAGAEYFLLATIDKGSAAVNDLRRRNLNLASLADEIAAARGGLATLDGRLDVSLSENGKLKDGATAEGNLIVNGKLGIGTTAPQSKLDVEGAAVIGAAYSGTTTAPTNGLLVEGQVGIGTTTPKSKLDVEGNAVIGATYSGTTAAPANGLLVEGYVGIGTNDPQDLLDVAGDLRVRGGDIKDSGGKSRITFSAAGNLDLKESNGAAVLRINTDGRAGINASTKLSQFTIKGSSGWKSGTVAYAAGSANVVGTGTSFLSTVGVGDLFHGSDQAKSTRYVVAITDDTHLTVDTAFTTTQNNSTWFVRAGLFRVDDLGGTPKFFISNFGNVGIGTLLPGGLLDVRGTIRLHNDGSHYAAGGLENLRMVRGTVSAAGTSAGGAGFTVQKKATGIYQVTFAQAFLQTPTVVATQHYPDNNDFNSNGGSTLDNCVIIAVSTTAFRIKCGDGEGNASDRRFEFIAMGLR